MGGDDWSCDQTLGGHSSTVWMVDFSPDGSQMVTCSDDSTVIVWSRDPMHPFPQFTRQSTITGHHPRTIYSVSWSHPGILTACGDDAIRLFTPTPATPTDPPSYNLSDTVYHAHSADVNCVKFNPEGTLAASCSDDGVVKIWEVLG
eukprot:TRINITY_DN4326_c0_g1_i2.p1 TRINITY_DN4326_c0_g1~~TRINITY_DN4326_c0_g1_i2.p1  ORF type:complete len:146 (+),score=6.83 TRINITY_DN4326_c0_g1_i2:298-735(+)